MRAARILQTRPERAIVALAELCEERKEEDLVVAPLYRAPTLPPQTPYTVGSQTLRPKISERFSPPANFLEPGPTHASVPVTLRPPPEHMAPKRSKWTSPPPPEASSADHTLFESELGKGLQIATSSTDAREKETMSNSSDNNSEIFTDEGSDPAEDDLKSVKSYTETTSSPNSLVRRPSWHSQESSRHTSGTTPEMSSKGSPLASRGRFSRSTDKAGSPGLTPSPPVAFRHPPEFVPSAPRLDTSRRSSSGPSSRSLRAPPFSSNTPIAAAIPLPPSPDVSFDPRFSESSTVFYQTANARSPRPIALYPNHGPSSLMSHYQTISSYSGQQSPPDIFPPNLPPSLSSLNPRATAAGLSHPGGPETPTPTTYHGFPPSQSLSNACANVPMTPPSPNNITAHSSSGGNAYHLRHNSPRIPHPPSPSTRSPNQGAASPSLSNSPRIPAPPVPSGLTASYASSKSSSPAPSLHPPHPPSPSQSQSASRPPTAVPSTINQGNDATVVIQESLSVLSIANGAEPSPSSFSDHNTTLVATVQTNASIEES